MKKSLKRILCLVAVLSVLAVLLTACGGSSSKLSAKDIDAGDLLVVRGEGEGDAPALTADQLRAIATLLCNANSTSFPSQDYLVAASRGYNMVADDFDAKNLVAGDVSTAAVAVIQKANASVKADKQIADFYTGLNEYDVAVLVNAFQTEVDVSSGSGFVDKILCGIGVGLQWLTNTVGFNSYLVGICEFAVIVEILMLPFAIKQQKNSIRQATLRPKEMAIRNSNRYKGKTDQATMQKLNAEIQELYQKENYSPFSGCLPFLIQLPIIMALYNIVINPLHYVLGIGTGVSTALSKFYTASPAAGGLGLTLQKGNGTIEILSYIRDNGMSAFEGLKVFGFYTNSGEVYNAVDGIASRIPNFNIGSINFGQIPDLTHFNILLLVPVLIFVAYFFSSKLTRKMMGTNPAQAGVDPRQAACSNAMMDVMMPAMSTYFSFIMPALVGVYWIFRSLLGMLKQFILVKAMPLPVFTEEDYKRAEREMNGKRAPVKKSDRVGTVRSLHHIDDEDYDDTRERALARKAAIEAENAKKQEAAAEKALFEAPSMKDDKTNQKNNENKS